MVEILVGCLTMLFVSAFIVDWLLGKSTVDQRERLRVANTPQEQGLYAAVVTSANVLFCQFFDAVYGENFWSWRRFLRSCFLSGLALFFVALSIGLDRVFMRPSEISASQYFMSYSISLAINLVADYISLQETRWVLGRTRNSSTMAVLGWVCIDLALTAMVFFAVVGVALGVATAAGLRSETPLRVFLFDPSTSPLWDSGTGLPFLLSTFGTSALWLLFVLFVLVAAAMRNSRFLTLVFDAVADNPAPARAVAVIVAIPIVVVGLILIAAL